MHGVPRWISCYDRKCTWNGRMGTKRSGSNSKGRNHAGLGGLTTTGQCKVFSLTPSVEVQCGQWYFPLGWQAGNSLTAALATYTTTDHLIRPLLPASRDQGRGSHNPLFHLKLVPLAIEYGLVLFAAATWDCCQSAV